MLAHNIKAILTLVPEATSMVKKANLEEDFPLDSKDSACASYLRVNYLTKVAERKLDSDLVAKIEKAAELYGVKDEVEQYLPRFNTFEKKASETQSQYGLSIKDIEAGFEGDLAGFGFLGIEKAASEAKSIVEKFGDQVKSAEVLRYAGKAYLNKEAAVKTLANRFYASKEQEFVKLARAASEMKEDDFEAISNLCATVTGFDKKAGLDIIGFNFYREALLTKEAQLGSVMSVNLAGTSVPWESIQKFGKDRIASTVGSDVASAMTGSPVQDKAMLESLPRDVQLMIASLVKGV